ncbi:MAG: toprim domain-containing protein [Rhodospirillales bacterium]
MTAESIARALGGRKTGGGWAARCPAHGDRIPSLSIRDANDGKVLVRCHAGCDQRQVIAALRARGLWTEKVTRRFSNCPSVAHPERRPDRVEANHSEAALAIWQSAKPAGGRLVETYLASRGIHFPLPPTLRFKRLRHPSGGTWPAMVTLVVRGNDGVPLAIHRTFLARDGRGKAPVDPQKMMLGPCGGGAVALATAGDVLMVGEGIETCLAAMQATGYPAWAALSTSGLRALGLPGEVREVTILADGDDPGEAAARDAAMRWKREGRHVRIARPPKGLDFNDMLLGQAPRVQEDVT